MSSSSRVAILSKNDMRLAVFILSLLSILFGPWWGLIVGTVALSVRHRAFEMVLLGAIADALWLPGSLVYGVPVLSLTTLGIVWIFEPLRRELFVI